MTHHDDTVNTAALRRRLPAVLVAAAVVFGLPAAAHSAETGAVKLQYSRAALKTEDGARVFYAKLEAAARRACGDSADRTLRAFMAAQECRVQAVAAAVESVDSRMLAAVHESETGTTRLAGAAIARTSR